jgi:putative peptidoglycan lipid II flippase
MVRFRERLSYGIRLMTLVVLPSAVGMIVVARPLIASLLGGGFAPAADVLANFAIGLLAFSLYLFLLRGFYAQQDTRTPFFLNVLENGVNVLLAFALVGRFGVQGLAFAYSAAYVVAAAVTFLALRRRVGRLEGRRLAATSARIAAATAIMGIAAYLASRAVGSPTGGGAVVRLVVGVVVGVVVYGACLLAFRVEEIDALRDRLRDRRRGGRSIDAVRG